MENVDIWNLFSEASILLSIFLSIFQT